MAYYIKLNPVGDCDQIQYFSHWVKHRPDMPEVMRQYFSRAGVKVGESAPIFTTDPASILAFEYEGMAQYTANRIGELIPDFDGQMTVERLNEYSPSDEGEVD